MHYIQAMKTYGKGSRVQFLLRTKIMDIMKCTLFTEAKKRQNIKEQICAKITNTFIVI